MKVLHLVDGAEPECIGGVERHVGLLCSALKEQQVAGSRDLGLEPRTHRFLDLIRSREECHSFLETHPEALLHVHQILPWGLSALIRQAAFRPVVLTLHDWFFVCQRVHLRNVWGQRCEGPSLTKCSFCTGSFLKFLSHMPLHAARRSAFQTFLSLVKAIILPNPDLIQALPENLRSKSLVLDYAVPEETEDLDHFDPEGPVVCLGSMGLHKGLEWLAEKWREIRIPLHFYGPGTEEIREESVKGFGSIASLKELQGCRALIVPSDWRETGPLVLLEALALKIPVFVRKSSVTPARLKPGVRSFQGRELVELMEQAIPAMRQEILLHPLQKQKRFEAMLQGHARLYEELKRQNPSSMG